MIFYLLLDCPTWKLLFKTVECFRIIISKNYAKPPSQIFPTFPADPLAPHQLPSPLVFNFLSTIEKHGALLHQF
jgi:hypothetical protein